MKVQFTVCPTCRSSFYHKVFDEGTNDVNCPYCRYHFRVPFDRRHVREVDYYWEVYSGLYSPLNEGGGRKKHLTAVGLILLLTIPFIMLPFYYMIAPGFLSDLSRANLSMFIGAFLALIVFLLFIVIGAYNSLKARSFALTLSGGIFSLLATGLSGMIITLPAFRNTFVRSGCSLMFIPLLLSLVAIFLCISNRKRFSLGY